MKIALIHNQLKLAGGMESYLFNLIKGFAAAGDTVDIYTSKIDVNISSIPAEIYINNFKYVPRRIKKYLFWNNLNYSFDRQKYDISISLTRTANQDIAVCGGTQRGVVNQRNFLNFYRRAHDRIEAKFEEQSFQNSSHIIAHSKLISQEIMTYYKIKNNKIKILYPPIDEHKYRLTSEKNIQKIRDIYGINNNKLNLLLVSLNHRLKGLAQLLAAFKKLDPKYYNLFILGKPIKSKLAENIKFLGYLEDLAPIYAAVDYTILPSHYEAFGLVVPESLQCGTPVIVTKNVGASELLSTSDGIILDNNHPNLLVETIKNLNKHKAVELGFAERHNLIISEHIEAIKSIHKFKEISDGKSFTN